jgi:hypothetical protein
VSKHDQEINENEKERKGSTDFSFGFLTESGAWAASGVAEVEAVVELLKSAVASLFTVASVRV